MEKRVDRNKELYKKIDREIAQIAQKNSNKEFENINHTLKSIDEEYFGEAEKTKEVPTIKKNVDKKAVIITAIVFSILFLFIVLLAVVMCI